MPAESASRRAFLKTAAAAGTLSGLPAVHAAGSDILRVGLVGCGDRGTGAASQALAADSGARLVAMADAFEDRLENSLETLRKNEAIAAKLDVAAARRFVGFDAYRQLLASGVDVVLLCTPPHFRPIHLKAAIEAGKHVFAEKPVAVDAPGVHSVLESCRLAVVEGTLGRLRPLPPLRQRLPRDDVRRIHDGAIGDVLTLFANDYRSGRWKKPKQPGWTEMLYQMRNWYNFTWLSGDFNVEQHVHYLDVCAWVMREKYPVKAVGMGGRQVLTGPEYGQIYDHFSVVYEYANGSRLVSNCRQQPTLQERHERQGAREPGAGGFRRAPRRHADPVAARGMDLLRPAQPDVPDRARRALRRHPQRQADQQRRVHGAGAPCWRSWAAWPPTPARRSPGRWR